MTLNLESECDWQVRFGCANLSAQCPAFADFTLAAWLGKRCFAACAGSSNRGARDRGSPAWSAYGQRHARLRRAVRTRCGLIELDPVARSESFPRDAVFGAALDGSLNEAAAISNANVKSPQASRALGGGFLFTRRSPGIRLFAASSWTVIWRRLPISIARSSA